MPVRRRFLRAAVAIVAAAGIPTALPIAEATAATTCTLTPSLPARISVGQAVVGLRSPIKANRARCLANFDASAQLVRGTDSFFLMWDDSAPVDVESLYAYEVVPGAYRTTAGDCDAMSEDWTTTYPCTVATASTTIKFASRSALTATRSGRSVTFTVTSKRFRSFDGFRGVATPVTIQRRRNGVWHTLASGTTARSGTFSWSYRHSTRAAYRVVTAETRAAFASNSTTVWK